MNSKNVLVLVTSCLISSSWAATAAMPTDVAGLQNRLAARFSGDRTGACIAAAVIDHDRVLRGHRCAGTREDGPPASDAAFEIGSVSKTMTAFLVADLIERGRWSLDDPIAKFLPAGTSVPRQGDRQILVRDLITHSAGLPALPPGWQPAGPANPYADLTEDKLLAALGKVQLVRPIGSQPDYSNFGMMVMSLAVARSEGGSLEAALRDRLFKPLGMSAFISDGVAERSAQGHLPGGMRSAAWTITPNLAGVGMVKASLADMERYARAGLGDGPEDVIVRMRRAEQPVGNGYAMNWARQDIQGHDILIHEGGTGGFSSLVALDTARHRAVVLLADTSLTDLGGLGDIGLSLLGLDVPVRPPRHAVAAPAALRHSLVGDYQLGPMALRIWEAGDERLMAQAQGQDAFELRHDSYGDFYPTGFAALLTPLPEGKRDAPVQRFAWHQGGGVVEARRLGSAGHVAPVITNPAWRDWAGEFELTRQFSLRVYEQDGHLMVQGTGQPGITATATGPDRIEIAQVGAVVEFERDAGGRVVAAALKQGGQVLRGPRR
jgi:serine-type D-Ala-D-Ala carboxypeptidase/endopeptidase